MKLTCSEISCQNNKFFQKDGFYFRKSDSKYIQRYRCKVCGRRTSTARLSPCYRQKKRTINHLIESMYCSKVSMRRIALNLNVDKKTVARKVEFLGLQARKFNLKYLQKLRNNPVEHLQFDDLITKERTKMLPVTISVAVDADTRRILSLVATQIPAFGLLAKKSRAKYGYRKSEHKLGLKQMFQTIENVIAKDALIRSDEHKFYPEFVQAFFPNATYIRHKGGRGCIAGQGELKKLRRDPLFALNHTCAMLRDNISRLVRKSWCVTQSIEKLQLHLDLYMKFHNTKLI